MRRLFPFLPLIASLVAAPAGASIVTGSFTAVIDANTIDTAGLFGPAAAGIGGLSATGAFRLDTASLPFILHANGVYQYGTNTTPNTDVSISLTLNGITQTVTGLAGAQAQLFCKDAACSGQEDGYYVEVDPTATYSVFLEASKTLASPPVQVGTGLDQSYSLGLNDLYTVNGSSDVNFLNDIHGRLTSFAINQADVPEPASLPLLLAGAAALVLRRRR